MIKPKLKYLFFVLGLLVFLALCAFGGVYRVMHAPLLLGNQTIIIEIKKNQPAFTVVNTLKKMHLIKHERLIRFYIRIKGIATQLKAGIYQIKPGENAQQFLKKLVTGDVWRLPFTIIEGTTQQQVSKKFQSVPYLNYSDVDWQAIMDDHLNAEGLLLADTYYYQADGVAKDILYQANKRLNKVLAENWKNRSPGLPFKSPYDLLIAASIIEKEASLQQEKKLIAGVLVNRLRLHMRLQMDPTIIYGLGSMYTGKLSRADMRLDSSYNTYLHGGLPPTPIAMVGKDAINAAAHPQVSNYLFYVAKGDGSHFFSTNYAAQRQAISRYLKKGL
ncbi:MAG: endolytic transglycosylase MltG [Legionella sp.]